MRILLIILLLTFSTSTYSMEKIFYITTNNNDSSFETTQLQELKKHIHRIDIIAPQIYQLNQHGIISGKIDPELLSLTKKYHKKIMPLIVNMDFNQAKFHLFLQNPDAQKNTISQMVALCKEHHFYGLQFDFENINMNDKNQFTLFFEAAAKALHQHGFAVSVAVVPRTTDEPKTDYDRWVIQNWSGAYDYERLAKNSDFLSIMSYDQHTSLTTPGPLAANDWVEKTIKELLKTVPAKKISLGIPSYSGHWSSGKLNHGNMDEQYHYRSKESQISFKTVTRLLEDIHQPVNWQSQWKSSYVIYENNNKTEYLFIENGKSFRAKLKLAKRYHLRGISVWKMGLEDPVIWRVLARQ